MGTESNIMWQIESTAKKLLSLCEEFKRTIALREFAEEQKIVVDESKWMLTGTWVTQPVYEDGLTRFNYVYVITLLSVTGEENIKYKFPAYEVPDALWLDSMLGTKA